jgi:hypothetical protein
MALHICLLQKQTPFPYLHEITLPECKIEIVMCSGNYTNNVAQITTFWLNSVTEIENRERLLLCYVQQALPKSDAPRRSTFKPWWFFPQGIPREISGQSDSEACFSPSTLVFPFHYGFSSVHTSIHKPHYVILVSDSMLNVMLDYPQEIQIYSTGISHIAYKNMFLCNLVCISRTMSKA